MKKLGAILLPYLNQLRNLLLAPAAGYVIDFSFYFFMFSILGGGVGLFGVALVHHFRSIKLEYGVVCTWIVGVIVGLIAAIKYSEPGPALPFTWLVLPGIMATCCILGLTIYVAYVCLNECVLHLR